MMRSNVGRIALGVAVVAIAVVLLLVLRDDGGDGNEVRVPQGGGDGGAPTRTEPEAARPERPAMPTIVIRDRRPVGGQARLEFDAGEQVRFRVRSDMDGEIHVHGYELSKDIEAGNTEVVAFPADIQGVFEVELHGAAEQIAQLRVNP